ncbi:MAG: cobalt-precorrin-6A reductase [Litoreibacter sp.]
MNILLLAGSGEARALAVALVAENHQVTASLSGATREAKRYACKTRVGGFGGDIGFEAYLNRSKPDLVIDATHPFAVNVSSRSHRICQTNGMPYLQLLRTEWAPEENDNWHMIDAPENARALIPTAARVFLATGRQTLAAFGNLDDCHLICRQIDPPDGPFPFPNGEFLVGRPPFSVEDEVALFKMLKIDFLVVKNAGGTASRSKLDAARILGLPVIMIRRPPLLNAPQVATVDAALNWINTYADH